jgi:predicted RNA methylase
VAADRIIGFDKRFAAEEVITQPLTVEYDKIIEQKFEEAVISESVAYAKVIPDAVRVLDSVWP